MAEKQQEIFVEIPISGEWPSPEEVNARNAVIDELDQLGIGDFIGSGGGMGIMDFSYRVTDERLAQQSISAALYKHIPNRDFKLEFSDYEPAANPADDGIPDSRAYIHDKCDQTTDVDGGDFLNLARPTPGMRGTMCAECGGMFPISEFKWADTGEPITAYYERYRKHIPPLTKWICSRQLSLTIIVAGFLAGVGFGIWCGSVLGLFWGIVIGIVSSFVGAIASLVTWALIGIGDRILNKNLGVADVRCLK